MNSRSKATIVVLAAILSLPLVMQAEQWTTPVLISELNSGCRDVDMTITPDGKTAYFASDRDGCSYSGFDIYVSNLVGSAWSPPTKLPAPINLPGVADRHPMFTLDGRYLYFNSDRDGDEDLYVSELKCGVWQTPVNLGPNVNSSSAERMQSVSADGNLLFFYSTRPGGYGGFDIYVSRFENGAWTPAQNLGPEVNDSANNYGPLLSVTGRYFFFNRTSGGYGQADVFRALWNDGALSEITRLPSPPNTSGSDALTHFSECTQKAMLQKAGGSDWDLYSTTWTDYPHADTCNHVVFPYGQWRLRVTLTQASASLKNDVYLSAPIQKRLIKNSLKNVGAIATTGYLAGEEAVFFIRVKAPGGHYDHYSNSQFAQVQRIDPLTYVIGFEDLPADQADWDFNDCVLLVELIGEDQPTCELVNHLGEQQLAQAAGPAAGSLMSLALTEGIGWDAAVSIPAEAVYEETYSVLVEGDPTLYADLLADAPFVSDDVFLKLEVTNGVTALDQDALITITYADDNDNGVVDGTTLLETRLQVYWFDAETMRWENLDTAIDVVGNEVATWWNRSGLYVVGHQPGPAGVIPPPLDEEPPIVAGDEPPTTAGGELAATTTASGDDDPPPILCGRLVGHNASPLATLAGLMLLLAPLWGWGLLRRSIT